MLCTRRASPTLPPDAAMKLRLEARVSSDSPDAVGRLLVAKFGATSVTHDGSDWIERAEVESASARDANRELLRELRRVERKTRLRAASTAGGLAARCCHSAASPVANRRYSRLPIGATTCQRFMANPDPLSRGHWDHEP